MLRVIYLLMSLVVLVTAVGAAQAEDNPSQPPIIAQRKNKWYAVSPVDGSARVLVEPAEGEKLMPLLENNLSPDGQWLAYVIRKPVKELNNASLYKLFSLNLQTGAAEEIQPSGVFDRPLPPTHVAQILYPTWSYDGTRLYYVRQVMETRGNWVTVAEQLAYYDVARKSHHMAGRLDPAGVQDGLAAVPNGMVLRTVKAGRDYITMTFFSYDNSLIKESKLDAIYQTPLMYEGESYYAEGENSLITGLVDMTTGERHPLDGTYYPAMFSRTAGDESLRVFFLFDHGAKWAVYSSDGKTQLNRLTDKMGAKMAVSPDGKHMAFILYKKPGVGSIQVMDDDGTTRDLQFDAELMVWGAVEREAFAIQS
jgi:hypothetical protein